MKTARSLTVEERIDEVFAATDFFWKVPIEGFTWESLRWARGDRMGKLEPKESVLTDSVPYGARYDIRRYQPLADASYEPLREKALFRQFAELNPRDKDAIRFFANRFGRLGVDVNAILPIRKSKDPSSQVSAGAITVNRDRGGKVQPAGHLVIAERYATWIDAIRDLSRAVRVHSLLANDDRAGLEKLISRQDDKWIFKEDYGEHERYGAVIEMRDWPLDSNDILSPARLCVQRWINANLEKHVAPRVLWDNPTEKQVFRFMPKNLLGAMWMQFARVFVGEASYRPCKSCQQMMTISLGADGFRADREFCSPTCRQRDHRRKVREAKKLNSEGKSIGKIANHFGTSVETVRGWLQKGK